MHAAAIAAELGIDRILCPRAGGVLSALGLLASERRRDTARTVMLRGGGSTAERIAAEVAALRRAARPRLDDATRRGRLRAALPRPVVRAAGAGPARPDPERAGRGVRRRARTPLRLPRPRRRGRARQHPTWRCRAAVRGRGRAAAAAGAPERSSRRVRFDGEWIEAEILRGEPPAGLEAAGPASSSCPRRPWCSRRAGAPRVDEPGRSWRGPTPDTGPAAR